MSTYMRRVLGLGAAATAAAVAHFLNERIVEARATRIERLRACGHLDQICRTPSGDLAAQSSFDRPIVVTGLLDDWPAREWTFDSLRKRIGQALVDTGSSTGGVPFYLVAANAQRGRSGTADLALYVFDSDFSADSGKSCLLEDVDRLPTLTRGSVCEAGAAAEHDDRPVWRWLLAGPEGSGTLIHQDPWGYSSWNALFVGDKRWILFPPSVPRETLHPPRTDLIGRAAACLGLHLPRGACEFMDEVLPALRGQGLGEVDLVQRPGEVIAFPAGWWHAVVNLDATLAWTESFGRTRDLASITHALRRGGLGDFANVVQDEATATSVVQDLPLERK